MSAFQIELRREPGYELRVNVRFRVFQGHGVLALPGRGRPDAAPAQLGDESDISADVLRAGRFVHHLSDVRRQAFSFSRLTPDLLARVPDDRFVQLEAGSELGFRYIGFREELPPSPKVVSVRVPTAGQVVAEPPAAAPSTSEQPPSGQPSPELRPAPFAPPAAPPVPRHAQLSGGRSLLERTRGRGENPPEPEEVPPPLSLEGLVKAPEEPVPDTAPRPPLFQEPGLETPEAGGPRSPYSPANTAPAAPHRTASPPAAIQPPPPPTFGSEGGVRLSARVPSQPPARPEERTQRASAPSSSPTSSAVPNDRTLDALIQRLEALAAENGRLVERSARLERQLEQSSLRERELLELLAAWQSREPEI